MSAGRSLFRLVPSNHADMECGISGRQRIKHRGRRDDGERFIAFDWLPCGHDLLEQAHVMEQSSALSWTFTLGLVAVSLILGKGLTSIWRAAAPWNDAPGRRMRRL